MPPPSEAIATLELASREVMLSTRDTASHCLDLVREISQLVSEGWPFLGDRVQRRVDELGSEIAAPTRHRGPRHVSTAWPRVTDT